MERGGGTGPARRALPNTVHGVARRPRGAGRRLSIDPGRNAGPTHGGGGFGRAAPGTSTAAAVEETPKSSHPGARSCPAVAHTRFRGRWPLLCMASCGRSLGRVSFIVNVTKISLKPFSREFLRWYSLKTNTHLALLERGSSVQHHYVPMFHN